MENQSFDFEQNVSKKTFDALMYYHNKW